MSFGFFLVLISRLIFWFFFFGFVFGLFCFVLFGGYCCRFSEVPGESASIISRHDSASNPLPAGGFAYLAGNLAPIDALGFAAAAFFGAAVFFCFCGFGSVFSTFCSFFPSLCSEVACFFVKSLILGCLLAGVCWIEGD